MRRVPVETELVPVRSITLHGPATALCADGASVLLLEASGARVLRFDSTFAVVETIPLTERVVGPRGIAADRFYIYVHDDRTLYRMQKENPLLAAWLNGVRTVGLAGFAPGEMLVSDADRATIWYKTLFGESRMLLDATDLPRPGSLASLPDGMFAALSGGSIIVRFNRAGIVADRRPLGDTCDLLVADGQGMLYLVRSGRPELLTVRSDGRSSRHRLGDGTVPFGLAVLPGGVVVLDRDSRLLFYPSP